MHFLREVVGVGHTPSGEKCYSPPQVKGDVLREPLGEPDVSCIESEGHRDSHVKVLREETVAEISKKQRDSCLQGQRYQSIFHGPE